MLRSKLALVAIAAAGLTAACAPTIGQNGFQAIDAKPQDIVAGTDTKQTVLTKLGTPSTTSTFERDNVWYYISQTTEKYTYNRAQTTQRSVTEIAFNDAGQVEAVRTLGLDDGQQVAMNGRRKFDRELDRLVVGNDPEFQLRHVSLRRVRARGRG